MPEKTVPQTGAGAERAEAERAKVEPAKVEPIKIELAASAPVPTPPRGMAEDHR